MVVHAYRMWAYPINTKKGTWYEWNRNQLHVQCVGIQVDFRLRLNYIVSNIDIAYAPPDLVVCEYRPPSICGVISGGSKIETVYWWLDEVGSCMSTCHLPTESLWYLLYFQRRHRLGAAWLAENEYYYVYIDLRSTFLINLKYNTEQQRCILIIYVNVSHAPLLNGINAVIILKLCWSCLLPHDILHSSTVDPHVCLLIRLIRIGHPSTVLRQVDVYSKQCIRNVTLDKTNRRVIEFR